MTDWLASLLADAGKQSPTAVVRLLCVLHHGFPFAGDCRILGKNPTSLLATSSRFPHFVKHVHSREAPHDETFTREFGDEMNLDRWTLDTNKACVDDYFRSTSMSIAANATYSSAPCHATNMGILFPLFSN